ncbi:Pentatricopeptide repeat [Dillenia turbinata]|uniref:Pentatricopeptide repeat n=1 Tax=Dillenia turbinata TaxID=194707 RepID=A0AAN8USI2_9MAGN
MIWRRSKQLSILPNRFYVQSLGLLSSSSHSYNSKLCKPITLNPQFVHSTLSNCASDLLSLSFFLWCARQPNYFHDRSSFNFMINVLTRLVNKFKNLNSILEELQSVGCVVKAQTFLILLRIFWHGGMHNWVFDVYQEMVCYGYVPNSFARNVVMDVLFKTGNVDVALEVLRENPSPNFLSFNIAICNLCKLFDLGNVRYVFRMMLRAEYYPNPETFSMVLDCFCKKGRLVEVFQVLGMMITLGIRTSVRDWSIIIDGFCRTGKLDKAVLFLDKMIESGASPNVVTYTSLVKGLMESHLVDHAFAILNTMEREGCSPDLVLCNVLIDCFSKNGRFYHALFVFNSLSSQGLIPDSYTFCSILVAICSSRKFGLLPKMIGRLIDEADLVVCNSLLSYLCKAGFHSCALKFYDDMLDRGFLPDRYTYAAVLCGLCGTGRINEAINVYQGIVLINSGLDAHVHTIILDRLIKEGRFNRAITLFKKAVAERYPLDVVSYTIAIQGLLKCGQVEEAFDLYGHMKKVGVAPNAYLCNVMLSGLCTGKDVEMVLEVLQEMYHGEMELNLNTVFKIMDFIMKSHDSQPVLSLLIKMSNLGLAPARSKHSLFFDGIATGVEIQNQQHLLPNDFQEGVQLLDASRMDNLSEVAASVG